jgi:hypothetical protein
MPAAAAAAAAYLYDVRMLQQLQQRFDGFVLEP